MVLARMSLCVNIVCDAGIYAISFRNFFFPLVNMRIFWTKLETQWEEKEKKKKKKKYLQRMCDR